MDYETKWFTLYMGLITMYHHPRNEQPANAKMLAELTDYYMHYYQQRGEHTCHGSSEEQSSAQAYSAAQPNIRQTNPTST